MNVLFSTTATLTQAVDIPLCPEAVSVYLVFCCGDTSIDPTVSTLPTPLSIATDAAWDTLQRSVTFSPGMIKSPPAENSLITGHNRASTGGAATVVFSAAGGGAARSAWTHPDNITAASASDAIYSLGITFQV